MSLVVVGTVAFDAIENLSGKQIKYWVVPAHTSGWQPGNLK